MTYIYLVEEAFFSGHLNGARIPVFLHMLRSLRDGTRVIVMQQGERQVLECDTDAASMDAAFNACRLVPDIGATKYDLAVFQKGRPPSAVSGMEVREKALMLNDPRARQAANQFHELLSGRFGLDTYRLSAPLRYVRGLRQDKADMARFDVVYVQSQTEAQFLRRHARETGARVEIFKNSAVTLELFPEIAIQRGDAKRGGKFLLPVPPGARREGEYAWFLRHLAKLPDLAADTTVLSGAAFARHIPAGIKRASDVEDFQQFLGQFDCVLVPTGHYTGLNNRVFQAACAGCRLIASPQALEGLMPDHPALATAPRNFAGFAAAMKAFPQGSVAPEAVLAG